MSTQNTKQTDEPHAGGDQTTTERRTLRTLANRGQLDVVDLASALEIHPMTVELACERLRERERVRLVGSSRYRLAEDDGSDGLEIDPEQ